ncbi:glycosyltransferase [Priestia megaterium]|uniref:glycosyltransferase n=1 Tax=Priestia megaterium TaxID=1404 RepID=UPI000BF7800B|nr:glycosyltransferase [Priestia megaterium]PFI84723.1 hypothetical protein COI84_29130 [Priestia megaterium]PGR12124.1 hypothetical protein COC62_16075 [Priestia megaterium]
MIKRNILYVTHSPKKGGAEQSLIHLLNNINNKNFNLYLVCPANTEYLKEIDSSVKLIHMNLGSIKQGSIFKYLKDVWKLKRIISKHNIHIVHANGWRAPWYVGPLKIITNVKTIWHHRDKFESKIYNNILPKFFNNIICISHFVKSTLSTKGQKKTKVIYNGIDLKDNIELLDIKKKYESAPITIGTFGRIVEWKRLESIISAMDIFNKENHDWQLYVVGDIAIDGNQEYLDALKSQVKDCGLSEKVIFYGHTSNPLELMSKCHVTINFADREPFGRVVIESLLAKTPVIVANSGGAPEIVLDTSGGIIVEDNNSFQLANAVEEIVTMDYVNYEKLCETGYKNVYEKYNMKKLALNVESLYLALLK